MTELSIKHTVAQYIEGWKPTSLTYYCISQMAFWWAEEPPKLAEKVERVFEREPLANSTPTTPLKAKSTNSPPSDQLFDSRVNAFEIPQTSISSAPPLDNMPPPIPKLIKPLSHKLADGGVRFVTVYFLFPLVGHASLYCNGSLCGIKILCAVAVFNTDKEQSKRLMKSAFLHGTMAVTDFAIGHLSLIYGSLYALTPTGVVSIQGVILSKYETSVPHNGTDASPPPDLRCLYERCADILLNLATGNSEKKWWHSRVWEWLSSKMAKTQKAKK